MEKFDEIQGIKDLVSCYNKLQKLLNRVTLSITNEEAHVSTDWFFRNFKKEDVVEAPRDSTDFPIELQHNFDGGKIFTILNEKEKKEWDRLNSGETSNNAENQQSTEAL